MAKRINKAEVNIIILALIIGIPIFAIMRLSESIGWWMIIGGAIAFIAVIVWIQISNDKQRYEKLMKKYNDDELVEKLMEHSFWVGQTSGQLLDSLGEPRDIDEKVLKTKKKEVWKYNHQGGNRYGLRITLDNDIVVGWDNKT